LIDAEFALNTDARRRGLRDGRRVMFVVQASEKVYATYVLEATDKGGPAPSRGPRTIPSTGSHRCWSVWHSISSRSS